MKKLLSLFLVLVLCLSLMAPALAEAPGARRFADDRQNEQAHIL